jgi:hypothetical protein
MNGTGKPLEAYEAHFNKAASTHLGRRIGWLAAAVVFIGLLIAVRVTAMPSVVLANNPDCLREVARDEHTSVADMFRKSFGQGALNRASVVCSQAPGAS